MKRTVLLNPAILTLASCAILPSSKAGINNQPENPFFLYLALSSPHNPFLPPDFAKGKSAEGPRGDLVTVVDWSVGQVDVVQELGALLEQCRSTAATSKIRNN